MADYYPLLARAISSLPQNTAEARKAVFDRARTALLRQLRGVDPPLPEGEITRERLALEEAIRRVEADNTPQDNAAPGDDAPNDDTSRPENKPPPEVASRGRVRAAGHDLVRTAVAEPAGAAPVSEPGAPEPAAGPEPVADDTAEPAASAGSSEDGETSSRRAVPHRSEVRSREAAKSVHPSVRAVEPQKVTWKRFALWIVLAVAVLGGIVYVLASLGLFSSDTRTVTSEASSGSGTAADQPKNADRIVTSTGETARRAPTANRAVNTQRAVLLEESPGGASAPQSFDGTVTWKTETFNAGPGLPPDIGVLGEITIPERQIALNFVLRRNTDQTLPASHTIEMSFKLPQDFAFGGIANVPGVRAKQSPQGQGLPLAGLSVKVNPTLFLVGLSPLPNDRQRNLALLQLSPWFDVPVVYNNGKKAAFLFEKGPAGEQAFNDAFSAWGELIQQQAPAAQ